MTFSLFQVPRVPPSAIPDHMGGQHQQGGAIHMQQQQQQQGMSR